MRGLDEQFFRNRSHVLSVAGERCVGILAPIVTENSHMGKLHPGMVERSIFPHSVEGGR